MPTVSYGITNTADDVSDGTAFGAGVDDTSIIQGFALGAYSLPAGLRFLGVDVPQGAVITAATLTLKKDASQPYIGTAHGSMKGVATDNAPAWTTTRPGLAGLTTQSVAVVNSDTVAYDVAAIVQAIVNRGGWVSGNALAFAGDTTGANGAITWVDYATSPANAAQLSITYDAGGPDVAPPTITSSATPSVAEGVALSHALTANETVTWTKVGGANAAAFTLTGSTLALAAQTYPAGPFVVVIRATDTAGNWTEQTITVSITEGPAVQIVGFTSGTTSAAAVDGTLPGDIQIAFAYRENSNTLPTLAAGWTELNSAVGGQTNSSRLCHRVAGASNTGTGTFTSATTTILLTLRPKAGHSLSIGASAAPLTGATNSLTYGTLSLVGAGSNRVFGFAGHRSINTTLETPPAGMANIVSVLDATDEAVAHASPGAVSAWTTTGATITGTASGWRTHVLEVVATAIPSSRPTFQAFIIG